MRRREGDITRCQSIDRDHWSRLWEFSLAARRQAINPGQAPVIIELNLKVAASVELQDAGDAAIRSAPVGLWSEDLGGAWDNVASHQAEIEQAIRQNAAGEEGLDD